MQDATRGSALLTSAQMSEVDRAAAEAGLPTSLLMDRAGAAVADHAERLWRLHGVRGAILVLCGPGHNGGDGIVAAVRLQARNVPVRLALLNGRASLTAAAAAAIAPWAGAVDEAAKESFAGASVVVDALFGAGLGRPLEGAAAALVERLGLSDLPILAVDVPSGVDGTTGEIRGCAARATETVTFVRLKPGHLLLPGREYVGRLHLVEIGVPAAILATVKATADRNGPSLWLHALPQPLAASHKYTRGHALVLSGGPTATGAARMSARGALRIGAGLVTLGSPTAALAVNASHLTAVMLRPCDDAAALSVLLEDPRKNAVVLGPGLGGGGPTRLLVEAALRPRPGGDAVQPRATVLDADALTSFTDAADELAALIAGAPGPVVVTPHDGEFNRLFGAAAMTGSRLDRARAGARRLGATMVLKGADTVVAGPDGYASIASEKAPDLATAGSGDVLSGMIAGLLAQGMPAFLAASAAVWCHADAARRFGAGLIAEDLPEQMPAVLAALRQAQAVR